jgi:hypothetical protein
MHRFLPDLELWKRSLSIDPVKDAEGLYHNFMDSPFLILAAV